MFDVYWDRQCVCGGYETADGAAHAASVIIERNNGEVLAEDHDGNNWWCVVRFYNANGFAEYECLSVRRNTKESV